MLTAGSHFKTPGLKTENFSKKSVALANAKMDLPNARLLVFSRVFCPGDGLVDPFLLFTKTQGFLDDSWDRKVLIFCNGFVCKMTENGHALQWLVRIQLKYQTCRGGFRSLLNQDLVHTPSPHQTPVRAKLRLKRLPMFQAFALKGGLSNSDLTLGTE